MGGTIEKAIPKEMVAESSTTTVEPVETDDFDYKGLLESIKDEPLFRYHYLGESDAIDDEEITPEEYEEIVSLKTDDEAIAFLNDLIKRKARAISGKHYSGILREQEDENSKTETKRGIRKKLSELGRVDNEYGFNFGDTPDDFLPVEDEKFVSSKSGKLLRYLLDKGYNTEQLNDMSNDELYGLASRVNGHENKILRKTLESGTGQERPVLVSEKRVIEKNVPDDVDESALRGMIREAHKNGDKETLALINEKLRKRAGLT
jgi:hypothetical protein